ncbi:MAG: cytochrome P450 [Acidimicrobiia bacterium]|nr:cytochrome P450 [Acidimicrobiia bacterium]
MGETAARNWATDYELLDPSYVEDPWSVWDELRSTCPVAHTDRHDGSWMPTRYDDLVAIAQDVETFTSRSVAVMPPVPGSPVIRLPPIDSDPPEHHGARRLILPAFSPRRVRERDEPFARKLAAELIDGFIADGRVDAAVQYAQQIPPRVIAHMLGVPDDMSDTFVDWVRGILELGYEDADLRIRCRDATLEYFVELVGSRVENPGDDVVSELLAAEIDGRSVTPEDVIHTCVLLLIAGIDTTWSSIGSAIWHLAQHPGDRRRLVAEPELVPVAVEELLRAYSPVTMARIVSEPTVFRGCPMDAGDRVIMNFPAGNRDPEVFDDADKVIIDRAQNRHMAFGVGIHRCAGSNQARLEMRVAIEEWLARIPEFELEDPSAVTWAAGQVRGPRVLPVVF